MLRPNRKKSSLQNLSYYKKKVKKIPVFKTSNVDFKNSINKTLNNIKKREIQLLENAYNSKKFVSPFSDREFKTLSKKLDIYESLSSKKLKELNNFKYPLNLFQKEEHLILNFFIGQLKAIKLNFYKEFSNYTLPLKNTNSRDFEKINKIRLGMIKLESIIDVLYKTYKK